MTSIGRYAFSGCSGLTSVEIPNNVTTIGDGAFQNCTGLTSVEIPNSVTSISKYAFDGCSGLTSVEIPNSVTSIGESAFSGCSGLTSVTIPNSVTSIGEYAFYGTALFDNQPDGVVYIDKWACAYKGTMPSNTHIELMEGTVGIADRAFNGYDDLTSVTIPNSVTSIGGSAFRYTAWFDNQPDGVVYAGKVAYTYKGTMPRNTHIELMEGTVGIADYAFNDYYGLTSVTIPNSVTRIGKGAFYHCSGLTSVEIPNSVTSIGDGAFYDCDGLTSVTSLIEEPFAISFRDVMDHIQAFFGGVGWPSAIYMSTDDEKSTDDENYVYKNATLYVPAGTKELEEFCKYRGKG